MHVPVGGGAKHPVPACGIAVMAKASIAGRTKTRLVPPLTFEESAKLNTAFLRDIADNILAAAAQASIAGYMAFGPPQSRPFFEVSLPDGIGLIEAWYPDLGDCLIATIAQLFARGHRYAVVLNSDSPTLPRSLLLETAQALAEPGDRAVLGPADDGGYFLLGLKREHHRLFRDIAWSTADVTRQTLERARALDLPVRILPTWYDVDDVKALKLLLSELFEERTFAADLRPDPAPHTRALMQALIDGSDLRERLAATDAFGRAAE